MNKYASSKWQRTPILACLAAVALTAQACKTAGPTPSPSDALPATERKIRLNDGTQISVTRTRDDDSTTDVVSINGRDGDNSESHCSDFPQSTDAIYSGSYDNLVALFRQLQQAIAANDRQSVSRLMSYPLRVNGPKPMTIKNSAELLKRYQDVFNADVIKKITTNHPETVFCTGEAASFGGGNDMGTVWATSNNGTSAISVINH